MVESIFNFQLGRQNLVQLAILYIYYKTMNEFIAILLTFTDFKMEVKNQTCSNELRDAIGETTLIL